MKNTGAGSIGMGFCWENIWGSSKILIWTIVRGVVKMIHMDN